MDAKSRQNLNLTRTKLVVCLLTMVAAVAVRSGAQQNSQYKIALLPFVDNSGSGGQDLATALARAVQAEIAHSTQLQGRAISLDAGMNPASVDANKAVQIGQSQNVDVVMLGTVLEANSQRTSKGINGPSFGGFHVGGSAQEVKAVVTLQGDLYDVTSGQQIESIRVTGNSSQKSVGGDVETTLGDLSSGNSSFDNSAMGKAFHSAVADLVKRIVNDQPKMKHYAGGASSGTSVSVTPANSLPAAPAGGSSASATVPPAAPGALPQPDLKSTKIDFIPGEKTLFYDDFSDMAEDEPPPHWKVRGGTAELRTGGGIHQLNVTGHSFLISGPLAFPENFTLEVDEIFSPQTKEWPGADWKFQTKNGDDLAVLATSIRAQNHILAFYANDSKGRLGARDLPNIDFTQPVHLGFWVQNKRLRVYVNGERVLDANETAVPPPAQISVEFNALAQQESVGIRRVRVAESTPDFSTVISSTGKYVTHGINFDTDSDRLKSESAPILKQVAAGLEKNPNLKLEIDGYTDSVGDAAHNLDLSQRRAGAVRSVLVSQFGIDAARLSSNGFGAAKPIGSNDTPEGRAANRRVEFLKE
jgi:OmpA-OmpF porin, OOP family